MKKQVAVDDQMRNSEAATHFQYQWSAVTSAMAATLAVASSYTHVGSSNGAPTAASGIVTGQSDSKS